jgi:hypothetical protein
LALEPVEECFIKPNSPWVLLSAGERQALEFFDKVKMHAEACQLAINSETTVRTWNHPEALMLSQELKFPNGSWIKALPSNPATISGYSANVIWDEAAKHEKARELWRNFFPSITNPLRGTFKLRIASTPMGRENKFADIWHSEDAEEKGNKKKIAWSKHRTDIYEAVRNGLCHEDQTPDEYISELRDMMDDPDGWAQEYECEFLDGSNVLLPYDLITACETIDANEATMAPIVGTYCGIDFGRATLRSSARRALQSKTTFCERTSRHLAAPASTGLAPALALAIMPRVSLLNGTRANTALARSRIATLPRLSSARYSRPYADASSKRRFASRFHARSGKTCTPCSSASSMDSTTTGHRAGRKATQTAVPPWRLPSVPLAVMEPCLYPKQQEACKTAGDLVQTEVPP